MSMTAQGEPRRPGRIGDVWLAGLSALWVMAAPLASHAQIRQLVAGHGCERVQVRRIFFTRRSSPDRMSVRSTGPTCARARIIFSLRTASGRLLWSEQAHLHLVEERSPEEDTVTFEHVIGVVENWASVESTLQAPDWPAGAPQPPPQDITQIDTQLDRATYLRIRASNQLMLCVAVGPENGHCLVFDPAVHRVIEFFGRGV